MLYPAPVRTAYAHPSPAPAPLYSTMHPSTSTQLPHAPFIPAHEWPLKTIELVEVSAPPPPRRVASVIATSTGYYSSSYASSSSSDDMDYDEDDEDEECYQEEEEEDEAGTEYCSSDEDELDPAEPPRPRLQPFTHHRVLAWRELACAFAPNGAISPALSAVLPLPATDADAEDDDVAMEDAAPAALHACCSACDACFVSISTYRRHGSDMGAPEPCRAAVSYGLESARSEP